MKLFWTNANSMARCLSTFIVLNFLNPASVYGCPTCKDSLHDSSAFGFAISIIFMMLMPFFILAFWTITVVRLRRQAALAAVVQRSRL